MAGHLSWDLETRSPVNLLTCGVYVYAESPDTDIILASYSIDHGPKKTWYIIWGMPIPEDLEAALLDPECLIHAWNAAFERLLILLVGYRRGYISRTVFLALSDIRRWRCTAATAAYFGLRRKLEWAAADMGVSTQKDMEGAAIMKQCCSPTRRKLDGTYAYVEDPDKIYRLGLYCEVDVGAEMDVGDSIPDLPAAEQSVYEMNERMNDRGVLADPQLLEAMITFVAVAEGDASRRLREATNGEVPKITSVPKLTAWLSEQGFPEVEETGIGKDVIREMLENPALPELVREVLIIRREGGKSSAGKFKQIRNRVNLDSRIRGSLMYCGAAASSRWSSRGTNLQNAPRGGSIKNIEQAADEIIERWGKSV